MSSDDSNQSNENVSCDPSLLLVKLNEDKDKEIAKLRKWLVFVFVAFILATIFAFIIFATFNYYPKIKAVQTVDNSVICPIEASKNPRVTDVVISEFGKSAILSVYNFDFLNWRDVINNAGSMYFTESGKDSLMKQIAQSQTVGTIVQNNLTMRTTATDVPQIENRDLVSAEPNWTVRVPITTQFFLGTKEPKETHRFIATVTIVEHPRSYLNYNGIAVKSILLTPAR
ncbi:DotI/IcmL family type IV secretion protein [Acinetobacter sp. YH01009]|uniref:DotI/IcmL family type IV secretion protein n=1 Tax=Acinetobacter TaxID=469 RepID=UPI0015D34511